MKEHNYAIRVNNVSKSFRVHLERNRTLKEKFLYAGRAKYREFVALSDVSVDVSRGSTVGLLGVNGSGKSTLLKLISRILYPDTGSIEVNGRVSSLLELGAGFHPDFSGMENIFLNGALMGLTRKEITRRLDEIIEFSELGDFINEPIRSYSSGMYMRLAFSVAVAVEPEILLIDEILAVGDAAFQAKCMNHLKKLQRLNKTIVIVTHDTGVVERICDRAVWLHDSRVQVEGEPTQCVQVYLQRAFQAAHDGQNVMSFDRSSDEPRIADVDRQDKPQNGAVDVEAEGRPGSHTVVFTAITLGGARGSSTVASGEPITLAMSMKSSAAVDDVVVEVQVFSDDGTLLFGANTTMEFTEGALSFAADEKRTLSFCIDRVILSTGSYYVTARLLSTVGEPYDFWERCGDFSVTGSGHTVGLVVMDHEWAVESVS